MKVLHGTWIPSAEADFIQNGAFYLWVETPIVKKRRSVHQRIHPLSLAKADLENFLINELGITPAAYPKLSDNISPKYFALPTANSQPLPSPELTRYLEAEMSEDYEGFEYWEIDCYACKGGFDKLTFGHSDRSVKPAPTMVKTGTYSHSKVTNVIKLLNDIHFLALNNSFEIQFGSDLLFWYHYTQSFKQIILKDQYIPALKYRELPWKKGKRKQQVNEFEIYSAWEIVSDKYDSLIQRYIDYMPSICVAGRATPNTTVEFFSRETLLRHFSECLLHDIVTHTPSSAKFDELMTAPSSTAAFIPTG